MRVRPNKAYYYFCAHPHTFSHDCQVCTIDGSCADALRKTAEKWKEVNGYKSVYVYDVSHNFVWNF